MNTCEMSIIINFMKKTNKLYSKTHYHFVTRALVSNVISAHKVCVFHIINFKRTFITQQIYIIRVCFLVISLSPSTSFYT
jgi:hypothetical protein